MSGGKYFDQPFEAKRFAAGTYTVPAEWLDYNGHMNIGYYGLAFYRAVEGWYDDWMDLGAGYAKREQCGPFALQSNEHYLDELREGEAFDVDLLMLDCDDKRWHMIMTITKSATGDIAATSELIFIHVDLKTRRSTPLPHRQRVRLEQMRMAQAGLARPQQVGAPLGIRRKTR